MNGTFLVPIIFLSINKIVQLVQLFTYLYYTYKLSKDVSDTSVSSDQQSLLHKLAIAMGAFTGLSYFLFMLAAMFDVSATVVTFTHALFAMQQSLHGECLSKDLNCTIPSKSVHYSTVEILYYWFIEVGYCMLQVGVALHEP